MKSLSQGDERGQTSGRRRTVPGRSKRQRVSEAPPPDDREERATVCSYFCSNGYGATKIQQLLEEEHSIQITRERVYWHVRAAAAAGRIRFVPPQEDSLQQWLRARAYPWLQDASVVQTTRSEDVAHRGATMLMELLQQHYAGQEVHIGFSGGMALRTLARRFAELLREPARHLPRKIVFHALVAGFDGTDPTTDPNAFFSYFVGDPAMDVETGFVAFHSPALVTPQIEKQLRTLPGIAEAYEQAPKLDVIVTSTSDWNDAHSMLRHYMRVAGEPVEKLENEGCIGDMLWQPIGPDGPFELKTRIRAMTIMGLSEVSKHVADKKHVLLVAGPCARCHVPKTDVVRAILDQEHRLVTHLAVDSRCVRGMASM